MFTRYKKTAIKQSCTDHSRPKVLGLGLLPVSKVQYVDVDNRNAYLQPFRQNHDEQEEEKGNHGFAPN